MTFWLDSLDPSDAVGAAKRARKISSHASFFKVGDCLGRKLVCVVKSGSVSSTIKALEPADAHPRGKKQPAIRKFLQGSNDALRVFKVRDFSPLGRAMALNHRPRPSGVLHPDRVQLRPLPQVQALRRLHQRLRDRRPRDARYSGPPRSRRLVIGLRAEARECPAGRHLPRRGRVSALLRRLCVLRQQERLASKIELDHPVGRPPDSFRCVHRRLLGRFLV